MSDGQPGLLSSVFGYLSREVQDFVTTATGGTTTEKAVASSSSRPRAKPKREARRPRKDCLNRNNQDQDEEEEWQPRHHTAHRSDSRARPYCKTSYSPTPSPPREPSQHQRRPVSLRHKKLSPRAATRPYRATPSPSRSHTPLLDEHAPPDAPSDDGAVEERPQADDHEEKDDEPAPLPPPRALRRRPSITTTMPGALFPRSPSMDPEPSSIAARHVHFPTRPPTYFDYEAPVPGPSSSPERPRPPAPSDSSNSIPRRPRAGSVGEVSGRRLREEVSEADAGGVEFSGPSSWKEKGKRRAARGTPLEGEASLPPPPPPRAIGAGRREGRVLDAGLGPASVDTSGEIRVRGKERELSVAREERRAREELWESEVETTVIREEKAGYEDKIKRLEEEVQRLRAELAKRPTASTDYLYSQLMPPPPPPPPPPLPLVLPRIPTTPAITQVSFTDVRAHLRHAGTPVEVPINSSFTAKRVGQPTIGVPADKMAAFLNEMKSVRLRKVYNAPADMGRPPPRAYSADNSFVGVGIQRPPRLASGTVAVGEKRKREVDTLAKDGVRSLKRRLMGPFVRSADTSFSSTNSSFSLPQSQSQSQSRSQSQSQSQSEAGPSKPPRSYIPVRTWPSSSVDGTDVTPSLTSDGDGEQGPEEPSPPTPPQVSTAVVQAPEEPEALTPPPGPEMVTVLPLPPSPPRRGHGISAQSMLDKRPPQSPLPAPTPRKARPPVRSAARARRRIADGSADENNEDSEDDPLASAGFDLDSPLAAAAAAAARPRRERKPVAAAGEPPRQARRRGSVSTVQSGGAPSKSKAARRLTLDEELRTSDGVTEADLRGLDIEPHVYTALPAPNFGRRTKSFLAHGGGSGVPVVMGSNAFDDAGTDDEVVVIEHSPPPPPSRKPKGRVVGGGGSRRR